MDRQLESFKLAGLRAGALVEAAAQDSSIVHSAMKFNLWRKRTKLYLKRLFKKATPPTGNLKILVHIKGGIGDVCMTRVFIKKLRETLPNARIYFAYDPQITDRIIIGHCGKHLDNYSSRKIK